MKMKNFVHILAIGFCISVGFQNKVRAEFPPLETVPYVDLERYSGVWYEIARYDQWFQKGCIASTATYSKGRRNKINVVNECRLFELDGEIKSVKGKAKVVDQVSNAKLKVSFFWPFYGKYWVIDLGKDYEYAVVGHPKRNYLWILSRTKKMEPEVLAGILTRLQAQKYDTTKLIFTPQQ